MLLYLLASVVLDPVPSPAQAQASAAVRIEKAARASSEDWAKPDRVQRREALIKDVDDRDIPIRIIEHQ